jgi:hypothetical protein
MTELEITLWATFIGAAVGSIFSVVGMLLNSWLTQNRERRQQVWQTEINRIIDLEERAGQLVERIGSHQDPEKIRDASADELQELESDAGRFRRHKGIMQAIRDLCNGLSRLLSDKVRHEDCRKSSAQVNTLYDKLLAECDKITGKRRI